MTMCDRTVLPDGFVSRETIVLALSEGGNHTRVCLLLLPWMGEVLERMGQLEMAFTASGKLEFR